jgi:Sigma-70 region 2
MVHAPESRPTRLGDVLYRNNKQVLVSEDTWGGLVQSIALGDQLALHALYARVHGIVFAWIRPFVSDRKAAEELMLDVFHDVWRTASSYNANDDTVVGWIMSQARSRAIDRLLNLPRFGGHPGSHGSAVGVCHGQTQAAGIHDGVQGAGRSDCPGER